jgi:hypothetical protein
MLSYLLTAPPQTPPLRTSQALLWLLLPFSSLALCAASRLLMHCMLSLPARQSAQAPYPLAALWPALSPPPH